MSRTHRLPDYLDDMIDAARQAAWHFRVVGC